MIYPRVSRPSAESDHSHVTLQFPFIRFVTNDTPQIGRPTKI